MHRTHRVYGALFIWILLVSLSGLRMAQARENVFSFTETDIDGHEVPLDIYDGKVLLIVNTASKCGFTPQYASLQKLYDSYKDRGFEVLAFPANNFKEQEPGTNEAIKQFCDLKFKISFPLFSKISVKGPKMNPLYTYLTRDSAFPGDILWNFTKFLIAPDGEVVARFEPAVDPLDPKITSAIEKVFPLNEAH